MPNPNRLSSPKQSKLKISCMLRYVDGMMEFDENTCTMIVETLSSLKVNLKKPYVGMLFNDTKEVHTFYKNYARSEGFGIVRQSSNTGLDGNWRYFTLACSRGAIPRTQGEYKPQGECNINE